MKRTRTKVLSILLTLCMVLTLLPTVAFAADATGINVSRGNNDTTYDGTGANWTWDAAADESGKLSLNGYTGGPIAIGGANAGAVEIELTGDNTITTSDKFGGEDNR